MAPPRNVLFITVDQWRGDCLSALGHPVVRNARARCVGRPGRPVRQPLGQRGALRPLPGLPLHGDLPAPQPFGAQRHPARRPLHQRGAPGPGVGLRPRPVRVHRYLGRPADGPAGGPPPVHATRASCPGSAPSSTTPGNRAARRGEHGWRPRAFDVPANPHELYEPIPDFPGSDDHGPTWAPARFPAAPLPDQVRRPGRHGHGWRPTGTSRSSCTPRSSDRIRPGAIRSAITTSTTPTRSATSSAVRGLEDEAAIHPSGGVRHVRTASSGRRSTIGTAARSGPRTTGPNARWTTGWASCSTTSRRAGSPSRR